jgi:hypothetical protein
VILSSSSGLVPASWPVLVFQVLHSLGLVFYSVKMSLIN